MLSTPGDTSTPQTFSSRRARRQQREGAPTVETPAAPEFVSRRARREAFKSTEDAAVEIQPVESPVIEAEVIPEVADAESAATEAAVIESPVIESPAAETADVPAPAVDVQQYPSRRSRRHAVVPQPDFEVVAIETDLRIADEAPTASVDDPTAPATPTEQSDAVDLTPAVVLDDAEDVRAPAIDLHLDSVGDDALRPASIADSAETPSPATGSFEAIISGSYEADGSAADADQPAPEQPEGVVFGPRHRASADAPSEAPKAPRSIRRLAAKTMSISAVLAVGLMTVATSVPANALLSADDVQAQKRVAMQSEFGTDAAGSQSMTSTSAAEVAMNRDTYGALSATEAAAELGIRPEATFTNDPNGTIQWPFAVGVHIGSGYGPRAGCSLGCSTNHLGQDFNPGYGAPIQSIADGVVVESTDAGGNFGVKIVIEHNIDGQMIHSVYGHMIHGSRKVQVGDHVSVGQIIGKTGSTGVSTGPHMHLEILVNGTEHVDPLAWLYEHAN